MHATVIKGQKINITKEFGITKLKLDIDLEFKQEATAYLIAAAMNEKDTILEESDLIYFENLANSTKSIGFSPLGDKKGFFHINFDKVRETTKSFTFMVAAKDGTNFDKLNGGVITIKDKSNTIVEFKFSGADFSIESSLVLCKIYKKNESWYFHAVTQGYKDGINTLLSSFNIKTPDKLNTLLKKDLKPANSIVINTINSSPQPKTQLQPQPKTQLQPQTQSRPQPQPQASLNEKTAKEKQPALIPALLGKGQRVIIEKSIAKIEITVFLKLLRDLAASIGIVYEDKKNGNNIVTSQLISSNNGDIFLWPEESNKVNIQWNKIESNESLEKLTLFATLNNSNSFSNLTEGTIQFKIGEYISTLNIRSSDFNKESAIVLAEIYKKDDHFILMPICKGFNRGIDELALNFGISNKKHLITLPNNNIVAKNQRHIEINYFSSKEEVEIPSIQNIKTSWLLNIQFSKELAKNITDSPLINSIGIGYILKSGASGHFKTSFLDTLTNYSRGESIFRTFGISKLFISQIEEIELAYIYATLTETSPTDSSLFSNVSLRNQFGSEISGKLIENSWGRKICIIGVLKNTNNGMVFIPEEKYIEDFIDLELLYDTGIPWGGDSLQPLYSNDSLA